jgi:hypothetical protein
LHEEIVLDLVADTEGSDLPPAWRRFVNSTGGNEIRWADRVSTDSIVAISSRMDVTPLIQYWLAAASEAKTEEFSRGRNVLKSILQGRDALNEILPLLLHDWTLSLVSASGVSTGVAPCDLVGNFATVDDMALTGTLDQAIQFGMTLLSATVSHQRDPASSLVIVESQTTNAGIERWVSGLENWSPAWLASPGQLVMATSHKALQARLTSDTPPAAAASRLAVHERRYFHGASQLVWIDSVRMRELLMQHGDWIASQLSAESTKGRQQVQQHLSRIEEIAKLFDAAFVAAQIDEQHVHVIAGAALDPAE